MNLLNITSVLEPTFKRYPARIFVHRGIETISLKLEDVALFYTENKLVFAVDKSEKKYLCDKNLCQLEHELDPKQFFRANRQYLINIDVIKSFKPFERVKLEVKLHLENTQPVVIISQQTAPLFKKWIYEA
jgi:DNA-binding LytR/AlgR family response regulator